jgi:DNA-binding MarR family transcriptional regulator
MQKTATFADNKQRPNDLKVLEQSLRARPGFLLRRCLQDTSSTFERGCTEVGITMRQYDYLFVLAQVEIATQGDISRLLGIDRSTNTLVLRILEKKGLAQRWSHPEDSRKKCVQITNAGRAALEQTSQSARQAADKLLAPLTDSEARQLMQLLGKVMDG